MKVTNNMKFEDIFASWEVDSRIDRTELGNESLNTPKLHHKYYMMFSAERSILKKLEATMRRLKLEKYEFYSQGHTPETKEKGWELPSRGLILKADIPLYMDGDKDIIELSLKIGMQQEKVDFLADIIKTLHSRGYVIKNAIDFYKFLSGA